MCLVMYDICILLLAPHCIVISHANYFYLSVRLVLLHNVLGTSPGCSQHGRARDEYLYHGRY